MTRIAIFALLWTTGCSWIEPTRSSPASIQAPALSAVDRAEVDGVVADLHEAASQRDTPRGVARFDVDALVRRSFSGMSPPSAFVEGATRGAEQAVTQLFEHTFVQPMAAGATLRTLRVEPGETGGTWAVLGVIFADGSFGQVRLLLSRDAAGAVRIVDVWNLTNGEAATSELRRLFSEALQDGTINEAALASMRRRKAMNLAILAGDHEEALRLYDALPPEEQKSRFSQIARISAAGELNDDARYGTAIRDFLATFPDDPVAQVHAIDAAYLDGDLPRATRALDALQETIGPDAYLHVLCANTHLTLGQTDEARARIQTALTLEPELRQAHEVELEVMLASRDHAGTVRSLDNLFERYQLVFPDMKTTQEFAAFVESPEYSAYAARQPR